VLGSNKGLTRGAERSPSLSVCVVPPPGDGGGNETNVFPTEVNAN